MHGIVVAKAACMQNPPPAASSGPQNDAAVETYTELLEQIVSGQPLASILTAIAELLEEQMPNALASILLLSEDGQFLRHGTGPSLPDNYNQAIDGVKIAAGVGSCGNAAATGELTVVEDIQRHPFWREFKHLAHKAGLKSCWSQPILNRDQQVLGTFAIYHRQSRP